MKIGDVGDMSPEEARDKARVLIGQIGSGGDPQADKRKAKAEEKAQSEARDAVLTIGQLADLYLRYRPSERKGTKKALSRLQIRSPHAGTRCGCAVAVETN